VRRLLSLLTVVAAVVAIPMAGAVRAPAVSLSASSFQVRYGDPIRLAGHVSNNKAGVSLGIFARSFTSSGFVRLATLTTGAGGRWTYTANPSIATSYQARTDGHASRTVLVGVRPAVSLATLASGRMQVSVLPQRFSGKFVRVQRRTAGTWSALAQLRLNGHSRALVPAAITPPSTVALRATISVNQAGPGYLGGFSAPIVVPARWVSLSLAPTELTYGEAVTLSGLASPRQAGMSLTILARPAAKPEFQPLATLRTGTGGHWSLRTHPRIGTVYQAQATNGTAATSRVLGVGVHPSATVRLISRGRMWTHIGAGRSMVGRDVQVQQLTEGQWHTVAKTFLNRNSEAVFPPSALPGGLSTLRIAMSVNQAGTGYLGAFSRTFTYQR
jgi:hypothetical protein